MAVQYNWRQGAVIYQIYPRSFYDNGNTGVGTLQGIIDKLDYLAGSDDSLGVSAIWLGPIFCSPMADFGYDVSDYTKIDPIFGTQDDLVRLIREAHNRSIKIILDFVPNHSSDEHPWFIESAQAIDNPKRDWYVWRDPAEDGGAPNNWSSVFGGSAWEYSPQTNQYYLHSFLKKQPDLNWDNPAVRDAMKTIMRHWLTLGIDGFRVDAVDWLSKDPSYADDTPKKAMMDSDVDTLGYDDFVHTYSRDGPRLFERLNEMAAVLAEYDDRFMITEAHPETSNKTQGYLQYYKSVNPHLSAPFNFQGIYLPWKAPAFREFVDTFQSVMKPGYTPIYTLGNHDEKRIASRIGIDAARTAAMMLMTLPGMAFIYYGEEIGMLDGQIPKESQQDPASESANRDPQRTPMQWDASEHAGFSQHTPWLPVADNYEQLNVAAEHLDSTSMLALYKRLIRFHNQSSILKTGSYKSISLHDEVFSYYRTLGNNKLLILLNFSDETHRIVIKNLQGVIQLSTGLDLDGRSIGENIRLRAHEGFIIRVLHN